MLVVADDLGYDPAIDAGILAAHRDGVVTATSALVDGPFAAAALAGAPRSLAVGLHLRLPPGHGGARRPRQEIRRQLGRFVALRGRAPAHVDGHRHVHAEPEVLAALLRVAGPLRLRVRALDAGHARPDPRRRGARLRRLPRGRGAPPLLDAGAAGRGGARTSRPGRPRS